MLALSSGIATLPQVSCGSSPHCNEIQIATTAENARGRGRADDCTKATHCVMACSVNHGMPAHASGVFLLIRGVRNNSCGVLGNIVAIASDLLKASAQRLNLEFGA